MIDRFDAFDHLAEGCILAVQMRCDVMHDKELAACGIWIHRSRHGQNATVMLQLILKPVGPELSADAVAGSADADALRISALDHESGNDAVEDQAVIEALFHQGDKVVHRVRSNLRIEFRLDDIAVFHFKRYNRISHFNDSFLSSLDRSLAWIHAPRHFRACHGASFLCTAQAPP